MSIAITFAAFSFASRGTGGLTKGSLERLHFRYAYGLSVDRMLAESPLDRDRIRSMRDSNRSGRVKAIRYVRTWDPVPLTVAAEFVDRL